MKIDYVLDVKGLVCLMLIVKIKKVMDILIIG